MVTDAGFKRIIVEEEFISLSETFKAGFRPTAERLDVISEKGNQLLRDATSDDLGESDA